MATTLSTQLAQIASKSSNPLDLKAQSKAHSQSLLFEPHIAANQDFDTLFYICHGGFQELCEIDGRFRHFGRTIFGEQSKTTERSRMSGVQIGELDTVLESFIRLVASRLLLKPGLKAVEWLIRRFRVHEHNTSCLIYAFLPYHTAPHFATLMSILPGTLPKPFSFLLPYVKTLSPPPKHAVLYAATRNPTFLTSWSTHVLKSCRDGHQYHPMTTYWATIVTESIITQLDQASARSEGSRKRTEEEILLRILPVLNEGLAMRKAPDMKVGCYMILTGLASRMRLEDQVLTAMMEAVVGHRMKEMIHAELICLAVLAQNRQTNELPRKVVRALISTKSIEDDLELLNNQYQVGRLCLGLLINLVKHPEATTEESSVRLLTVAVKTSLMTDEQLSIAFVEILRTESTSLTAGHKNHISNAILGLIDPQRIGSIVRIAIQDPGIDTKELKKTLASIAPVSQDDPMMLIDSDEMSNLKTEQEDREFELIYDELSSTEYSEGSFLLHTELAIFARLTEAFKLAYLEPEKLRKFCGLPLLHKCSAFKQPCYISFFIRVWCGHHSSGLRASAINCVDTCLEEDIITTDLQLLIPYIVFALADPSVNVRRAVVGLITSLWTKISQHAESITDRMILGKDDLYCEVQGSKAVDWLPSREVAKIFETLFLADLEECSLDASHIRWIFRTYLGKPHANRVPYGIRHDLKSSQKTAFVKFISSHIIRSPLLRFKFQLLNLLTDLERIGGASKSKFLVPLIQVYEKMDDYKLQNQCASENLDHVDFITSVARMVSHSDREGINALQRIISTKDFNGSSFLRKAALARLKSIWEYMQEDLKARVARTLFDLCIDGEIVDDTMSLKDDALFALRQLSLPASILRDLLEYVNSMAPDMIVDSSHSKRRKLGHGPIEGHSAQLNESTRRQFLRRTIIVLELVESSNEEISADLLATLFHLLADLRQGMDASLDTNYCQAVLLSCLVESVKKAKDSEVPLDRSLIRTDVVVDCFRTSTDTQVQNNSLLLLSSLAALVPDIIIDSVMPIFTFMGSRILRQSDDYSALIIDKTIDSIVPPLIVSLQGDKNGPLAGASKLILSFVAAYEHIPLHRRLHLFSTLVEKLGPEEYLSALLTILIDRHGDGNTIIKFALELCRQYESIVQLKTIDRVLEVVTDVLKPRGSQTSRILMPENTRDSTNTANALLALPMQLLNEPDLISKVARVLSKNKSKASDSRKIYASIMKRVLDLVELSVQSSSLTQSCGSVFNGLLNLLSLPESIKSLKVLLEDSTISVRRRVLKSLELRIAGLKPGQVTYHDACLDLLPQLESIIARSPDTALRQISITCIDRIVDRFGKLRTEEVANYTKTIVGDQALNAPEGQTRLVSLLCLSTFVEVLGEAMLPFIPSAISSTLGHLDQILRAKHVDEILYHAACSFLSSLLLYVPWMVTGEYLDQHLKLSFIAAGLKLSDKSQTIRTSTLELAAKQVGAQECFSALNRVWNSAILGGPHAIEEYLLLLRTAIKHHSKAVITSQSQNITTLFLELLDLRRIVQLDEAKYEFGEEDISGAEQMIAGIMIDMIYKLNDAHFKPLFARIVEWANHSINERAMQEQEARMTSFYLFLHKFFQTLKSIVTSYASLIVEEAADALNKSNPSSPTSSQLWFRVIATLHSAFEHDQDEFWQSPKRFEIISKPLLAQLEIISGDEALSTLVPCISALATATDSTDNMKVINTTILGFMRSESATVRLGAVKCEIKLTESLGEEWLSLLPEMLPFISEAMEDDDEGVEAEVRKWIRVIEGILGESLNGMLQ